MHLRRAGAVVARLGGGTLAGAIAGVTALRPASKPLHPRGEVWEGVLTRTGGTSSRVGVAWLDEPGHDDVLVRRSASAGLPSRLWDVQGLALKLRQWDDADVLLATTGAGGWSRFLLRPAWAARRSGHTSLLPYPSPVGPLLLRAVSGGERAYELSYALGRGRWIPFGRLELLARSVEEPSYDPVRSPHPELGNYAWVERLREPAYATARRSRGET